MTYKFEKLEVWKLAMKFNKVAYDVADELPDKEKYNLSSQLRRASTSIGLNIAEGSTGQSDAEQARFLSYSIRSQVEVIACMRLIQNRNYINSDDEIAEKFERLGSELFAKLNAFKNALD